MNNDEILNENPVVVDPVVDEPTVEIPVVDEPVPTETVVYGPIADDPVVETPVVDAPVEDTTLTPTDEIIPAPEGEGCPCGECGEPAAPMCPPVCGIVTPANFFGTIQESVTIIWRFHLKTRKYSAHIALNDFYTGAVDIVDSIIEQWQGINGICEDAFTNCVVGDGKSESQYLEELKTFVETNKSVLGCHSEINSVIDNLLELINTTLYKLNNLTENKVKSFKEFCYEDINESNTCIKFDEYLKESCCGCEDEKEENEELFIRDEEKEEEE